MEVQVIGGGIAGLVAAIEAADRGAQVRLLEAHAALGGRGRATPPPYMANEGPHVIYADGPLWAWLGEKRLRPPSRPVPNRAMTRFYFRHNGRLTRRPAIPLLRVLRHRGDVPVDESFYEWASRVFDDASATMAAAASGVVTYHHDPGALSARFVHERLCRAFNVPAQATYVLGGWTQLIETLQQAAQTRGVTITTDARVTELPTGGPVIVATSLAAARTLLDDASLQTATGAAALVDVAVRYHRGDAFIVSDLDDGGWSERFTVADRSLAPTRQSLIQAQVPMAPDEDHSMAIKRVEALIELAAPRWATRTMWRRSSIARGRTGAVDLPGHTWQDRPAIDRGNHVYLVGDQVAAPGLLSEVSFNSAITAAAAATAARAAGIPRRWTHHTAT